MSLTVVVVSDFEPAEKTWNDEIAMAHALARQDVDIDFDLYFVESSAHRQTPPSEEIFNAFPKAKVVFFDSERSAGLKDHGVSICNSEWVAVLETDALPEPDWLGHLMRAARENPSSEIFSGRTHYGDESSWKRVLNLLDRSFDDWGRSGSTTAISNNGALYRTEVIKKFPYPEAATPFLSSRLRNQAILQAGHRAYFERSALMRHQIGGIGFVMDFRRNTGFADRVFHGPAHPFTPLRLLYRRTRNEFRKICSLHGEYWRWYDWPLGILLFFFVRIPETAGMLSALKSDTRIGKTAYR